MTLSNIGDSSIDKALYAKIVPRKYVTFSTHSGNVRKFVTTDFVEGLEFDLLDAIVAVRKNTLAEVTANGHWYWDRDNQTVYFYYDKSLTEVVLLLGIFVTTTFDVLAVSDFDNLTFQDYIVYEGRLQETSFMQSCEDILNGKFGINTAQINIINNDSRYNYLAVDTISFKNAKIKVWIVVNSISNNVLIFNGLCESASFSEKTVNIAVIESTKALQQEATFGDTKAYHTINATTWPSSKEEDRNKIIPMFLSAVSGKNAAKTRAVFFRYLGGGGTEKYNDYDFFDVDPNTDFKMKYVGTEPANIAYPEGKKFVICRCPKDEFPQNFAWFVDKSTTPILINNIDDSEITVSKSQDLSGGYGVRYGEWSITVTSTSINYFSLLYTGMNIYLKDVTANTYKSLIVTYVDTTNSKFGVRDDKFLSYDTNIITAGHTYQIHYRGPTVYTVKDGIPVYLDYHHFWFKREATDGGNSITYCIITHEYSVGYYYNYYSNNEINDFDLYQTAITYDVNAIPDIDYYCRFLTFKIVDSFPTFNMAKVLNFTTRKLKEITTDSASDTLIAGNSYYDFYQNTGANTYVDIISPDLNSEKHETYLTIIEKILASTMSFLCMNKDGQLIVRMLESVPYDSFLLQLTEDDIKDGSVTSDIDFSEIASTISALPNFTMDAKVLSNSDRVRRICGDINYDFSHYLKSNKIYSQIVKTRLESYKQNPLKRYSFTIINKGYELTLGDRITISFTNSGKWLGVDSLKSLLVVRINKSLSGVQVVCLENNFPSA